MQYGGNPFICLHLISIGFIQIAGLPICHVLCHWHKNWPNAFRRVLRDIVNASEQVHFCEPLPHRAFMYIHSYPISRISSNNTNRKASNLLLMACRKFVYCESDTIKFISKDIHVISVWSVITEIV